MKKIIFIIFALSLVLIPVRSSLARDSENVKDSSKASPGGKKAR